MNMEVKWMAILQTKLESLIASILEEINVVLATRGDNTCW